MKLVMHQKSSKRLAEMGLIPPLCTSFSLVSEVNKPVKLQSDVLLTDEQYQKILAVLSGECDARPLLSVSDQSLA